MKGARDRKSDAEASRQRVREVLDQDTKKISASQLAEVLARVDGALAPNAAEAKVEEPKRTISGTRPIVRPPLLQSKAEATSRPSPTSEGIVVPEGPLAAVIERPVAETQVVNATVEALVVDAAEPIEVPDGRLTAVIERPVTETQVVNATSLLASGSSPEIVVAPAAPEDGALPAATLLADAPPEPSVADAEAAGMSIVTSARRNGYLTVMAVLAIVLAIAAALGAVYLR